MLRYVPAVLGSAALSTALLSLSGCADEERVRVREPRREVVVVEARPREVVVQPQREVVLEQPRTEIVVAQPRAEVVVAQPRIVETVAVPRVEVVEMEAPPVEHVRVAPSVVYEGHPVYWYRNRWYYQNGGRWGYYREEPIGLRGRRYVIR
jgi:hypothetical protein